MDFIYFSKASDAKTYITEKLKKKKVYVLASLTLADEVNKLICDIEEVKHVLYHTIDSELDYYNYSTMLR